MDFKPTGRDWADETAKLARGMVPSKTGRLRGSIRRKNASQRKATVVAHFSAYFIDRGTKAHVIRPKRKGSLKFQSGQNTIFSKRVNHPRTSARPFRERAAREGLRRHPLAAQLVKQWNEAA